MAVINNKIYVGSVNDPTFLFETKRHQVVSVSSEQAVSLSAEELSIDTLTVEVIFSNKPDQQVYKPLKEAGGNQYYDGYRTTDSTDTTDVIYSGPYTNDISKIAYATPVWWYQDSVMMGKFYFKNIERTGVSKWKIHCVSFIGILDRQTHYGGLYTSANFRDVADQIIGKDVDVEYYQAVEYLHSDGTAWMSTGIRDEADIKVSIDFELDDTTSSNVQYIFGEIQNNVFEGSTFELYRYRCALAYYYSDENLWEKEDPITGEVTYWPQFTLDECYPWVDDYIELYYEEMWQPMEPWIGYDNARIYSARDALSEWWTNSRVNPEDLHGNTFGISVKCSTRTISGLLNNNAARMSLTLDSIGRKTVEFDYSSLSCDQKTSYFNGLEGITAEQVKHIALFNRYEIDREAYENSQDLYLFGANPEMASVQGTDHIYYPAQKVYGCKIYKDNTLIRDYYPCYRCNDNVPGMYDNVSKSFFPSITEATFTIGPETSSPIRNLNGPNSGDPNDELANLKVTGWLPIDTRRNNLHRLCLAYNVNVIKDQNGDIDFGYMKSDIDPKLIDDNDIYTGGSITYDEPVTSVQVTEHTYYYNSAMSNLMPAQELLYDSSESLEAGQVFISFSNAPIYIPSINHGGNLVVHEVNENHAIVSGIGYLYGRPYAHTTHLVSNGIEEIGENINEKIISIDDLGLINSLNGSGVLDRLWAYYSAAYKYTVPFVVHDEKPGASVAMRSMFREMITGFITKMTINTSAIVHADSTIVRGYSPIIGRHYSGYALITENSTWTAPANAGDDLYVILIGAGQDGENGHHGEAGKTGLTFSNGSSGFPEPAIGGAGGEGGDGGNIKIAHLATSYNRTITATIGTRSNRKTSIVTGGSTYSTDDDDAASNIYGVVNLFTGDVYAYKGKNGIKGGNGGGYINNRLVNPENVSDDNAFSTVYYAGSNAAYSDLSGFDLLDSASNGLGGGAAIGHNGYSAPSPNNNVAPGAMIITPEPTCIGYDEPEIDEETGTVIWGDCNTWWNYVKGGNGGAGADASNLTGTAEGYGCGGNGGNGGGAGGAGGWAALDFSDDGLLVGGSGGAGGSGGSGEKGASGCILIYY